MRHFWGWMRILFFRIWRCCWLRWFALSGNYASILPFYSVSGGRFLRDVCKALRETRLGRKCAQRKQRAFGRMKKKKKKRGGSLFTTPSSCATEALNKFSQASLPFQALLLSLLFCSPSPSSGPFFARPLLPSFTKPCLLSVRFKVEIFKI